MNVANAPQLPNHNPDVNRGLRVSLKFISGFRPALYERFCRRSACSRAIRLSILYASKFPPEICLATE